MSTKQMEESIYLECLFPNESTLVRGRRKREFHFHELSYVMPKSLIRRSLRVFVLD